MTKQTKKYKAIYHIFNSLSLFFTIIPLLVYMVLAFIEGGPIQKTTMGLMVSCAIVVVAFNLITKNHLRSPIWICLLAIYLILDEILVLLIITACGIILDDFLFTPLAKHYHSKFTINKEIDVRMDT